MHNTRIAILVPRIYCISLTPKQKQSVKEHKCVFKYINDPSAGSPTETLLRLLFPPNHQV